LLCPDCRKRRTQARHLAAGRARSWLAVQHRALYQKLYRQQLAQTCDRDRGASSDAIRNRARAHTLGELQRRFPIDYRQRYAAELARAERQAEQQVAQLTGARVPYWQQQHALVEQRTHAVARLRALLWLASRYPDTADVYYKALAARLPLNPKDRTPRRRRALAWAESLDRLSRLHPEAFEARYRTELDVATRERRDHLPVSGTGRQFMAGLTSTVVEERKP
jgi:hypothetical protein